MREGIKQSGRGAVRALRSALLAGVVLLLSACGAVISTTLTVNEDGSGVRTITATLSASDIADHVTGGVAAIEGAITASLPSAMTYEGRTEGPEGESVFTFTVPFEDPEDYQEKVVSILGAGGVVDLDAGTRIVLADSVFRQGLEVEENFTSQDLLAWLVNSLVETGAVPADSSSNASEIGTTAVTVGGVAFETTAAIDFTSVKDFGVRGLSVETRGLEGESFVRSISYDLAREAYSRSPEGYDAFFDAATPEGGELTEPGEAGTTWVVTFPEGTSADVAAWTDVALASSTTKFGVEHAVSREQAGVLTTTVVGNKKTPSSDDAETRVAGVLGKSAYWPVTIAYFNDDNTADATPIYRMSFKLYENGITRDLTMDYGDFVLTGRLKKLELLENKGCT